MNKTDWQRRSALFDEAVDLPVAAREAWLRSLAAREPRHVDAVTKMLAEYVRDTGSTELPHKTLSLLGVAAREFEARLEAATDDELRLQAGDEIGAWRLKEKIGEGGMGAVWLAERHDGNFEGHAAIKFLRTGLGKTAVVERFLRERRLLARLAHPNIARLLDAGAYRGEPYLVMEYVEGGPINAWAAAHSPTVAGRVALMLKVCRAVEHAHGQLIVHRDLKPSNVLVGANGEPALLDFGIAKLIDDDDEEHGTALTRMTGRGYTLGYCAPEQITGEPTGVAADVFSIGVLLFELLSGELPFKPEHEGRTALEHAIVHTDARVVGRVLDHPDQQAGMTRPRDAHHARGDLEAIVGKSLRRKPADRYSTIGALTADLEAWLARKPISIRAEDRRYRSRLWLRRNWLPASLGAVASVAVVVGLAVSLWQRGEAIAAARLAQEEAARANKVADYLGELIQSASPDSHGGKWPTVLALLEQSEKDLDKQFASDPKIHALLLKKLVDTNDALNRNPVALAQLTKLHELLVKTQSADSDDAMDALKQRAQILRRMSRPAEAMEIDEALLPKFAARYGKDSEEYGKLLLGSVDNFSETGRLQEARQRLVDGAAIMVKLHPTDLAKRIDFVNDTAVLFTQQAMWREAMNTLATIEHELPLFAKKGGQAVRDSLIMRRNLEAIRVRVGNYQGVEERLIAIIAETDTLLGKDNVLSALALSSLRSLYCETGKLDSCLKLTREMLALRKRQPASAPGEVNDAEILLVSRQVQMGVAQNPPAAESLPKLLAAIAVNVPQASKGRADSYRMMSDAALEAGLLPLADEAQRRARADLAKLQDAFPEPAAQVDRSASSTAWLRGDARRAVQLLEPRFKMFEASAEGDSPRRAILWLQRALYELDFDTKAAAASVAQSREIFARVGGAQPHLKALLSYVDARIAGNASTVRAAEEAVDRTWMRPRPMPWRVPLMASL
ncbi:MAG: serine/threonine protein kinase [Burkholderiales bacterium]|nr:serine/threonine protein kinase [Burkholderiales bacterium]